MPKIKRRLSSHCYRNINEGINNQHQLFNDNQHIRSLGYRGERCSDGSFPQVHVNSAQEVEATIKSKEIKSTGENCRSDSASQHMYALSPQQAETEPDIENIVSVTQKKYASPTLAQEHQKPPESSNHFKNSCFRELLAQWMNKCSLPLSHCTELLSILRKHSCHSSLPKDARTLLKTPRKLTPKDLGQGLYYHFGIAEGLNYILVNADMSKIPQTLEILVNIDGVPISGSSNSQFWPIQGSLSYSVNFPSVFVIGLYHGHEKPENSNLFIENFVNEMNSLLTTGITIMGKVYNITFRGLICDAPARAFILCTKSHSGFSSCSKCYEKGVSRERRVCFPGIESQERTDETFRNPKDGDPHHKNRTFQLFCNSTAKEYSYYGKKGKIAFNSLMLSEMIFEAVASQRKVSQKEVERCVQDWLRHAKARAMKHVDRKKLLDTSESETD